MRKTWRLTWVASASLCCASCAVALGLDDFRYEEGEGGVTDASSEPASDRDDGGFQDAGAGDACRLDAETAPGNLLTNANFEQGSAGCGPGWVPNEARQTSSSTAYDSCRSCLVCLAPMTTVGSGTCYSLAQSVTGPFDASALVGATAQVSTPEGIPPSSVELQIFGYDEDGGQSAYVGSSSVSVTAGTWQQLVVGPQSLGAASAQVVLQVQACTSGADAGTNWCFLVDDAVLTAQ